MPRFTAVSLERFRADAAICRRYGLKVGSTGTKWLVTDNTLQLEGYVTSYGATPGERKSAAIEAFKAGKLDSGKAPNRVRSLAEINASIDATLARMNADIEAAERGEL